MLKNSQKKICIRDNKNNSIFNNDTFTHSKYESKVQVNDKKYFYLCSSQESKQILIKKISH